MLSCTLSAVLRGLVELNMHARAKLAGVCPHVCAVMGEVAD